MTQGSHEAQDLRRFGNKVVLVTGAASGQGFVEARLLVEAGATVVMADVQDERGVARAGELGPRAHYRRLDVSSPTDWDAALELCAAQGGLHGLVNNAGVYRPKPIADTDTALAELHFRVNQLGVMLGVKHCAPMLAQSGGGSIVNISSTAGMQGIPNAIAYGGTKWAVRGMTKSAALELAPLRIRVNSVHPGLIDTEMLGHRDREDLERRAAQVPLGRMGTSEDVARLVLFLLSDESAYVTGAELVIDGGLSL